MTEGSGGTTRIATSHAEVALIDTGGEGPAVVFIHGNSLGKAAFGPQLARVGDKRRCIAIDLPGHGESSDATDPERTYSLSGYADCIGEVLASLGVAQAVVVGWSLGGHIGIEMTESFAGLAGLMAIASPPFELVGGALAGFRPDPRAAMSGTEAFSDADVRTYVAAFGVDPDAHPDWVAMVARTDGRARRLLFAGLLAQSPRRQRDLVEAFDRPTAIVCCVDDPFVDTTYLSAVRYGNLWSGGVCLLEGCGHGAPAEVPERFNDLLARFLDDVVPVAGAGRG